MIPKRWIYLNEKLKDDDIMQMMGRVPMPKFLAVALLNRRIGPNHVEDFLRKSVGNIPHPYLLKDMDKAVLRIDEALKNQEKIVVYGDYDVDGITSTAMHIKSEIYGRAKHFYSIYRKMYTQNKSIDEIYDLFAVRVLVGSVGECYSVLGGIHEYQPYYLYRQKNMIGNLENIGYAKIGHESFYNVNIMEEIQTILALGCGGTSKIVDAKQDRISRVFNFKDPIEYISRFPEMLLRKEEAIEMMKREGF